jgi:hypothetical protein
VPSWIKKLEKKLGEEIDKAYCWSGTSRFVARKQTVVLKGALHNPGTKQCHASHRSKVIL